MRYVRWFTLLAVLSAVPGLAAWLGGTTSGLRVLAALVQPLVPATFDPEQIEGRLFDRIAIGSIEIRTAALSGSIEGLEFAWRPAALLQKTLHVAELRIVEPRLAWRGLPFPGDPPALQLPFWLPATVRVDSLVVVAGELRTGEASVVEALHVDLAGEASGRGLDVARLALRSNRGQLSGHARAALAVGAPWDAALTWQIGMRGTVVSGATRVTGVTERLQVSHVVSGPLDARLEGAVTGLPGAPGWRLALQVEPLPSQPALWSDALTASSALLTIEGNPAQSELRGEVGLPGSVHGPIAIDGRIGWRDGAAVLQELGIVLPDEARFLLNGRVEPARNFAAEFALQGSGVRWPLGATAPTLELPALSLTGSGAGERWRLALEARARSPDRVEYAVRCALSLDGSLLDLAPCDLQAPGGALRATVSGTLEWLPATWSYGLRLQAGIDGTDLVPVDASLIAVGDAAGLEVETLTAELLDGRVDGSGRLAWRERGAADFTLSFRDLDPARVAAGWPGRLSGALRLQGSPRRSDVLELRLEALKGELRALPVAGTATLDLAGDVYRLHGARLEVGRAFVEAAGELAAGILNLDVALDVPALATLRADAAGRLTATARITGPRDAPAIELDAAGDDVQWGGQRVRELRIAARADLSGARASRLTANLGGYSSGPGTAGAGASGDARLVLEGTPARHRVRADVQEALRNWQVHVAAAGGVSGAGWRGTLDRLSVTHADEELLALQAPAAIGAGTQSVTLGAACLAGAVGKLCLAGDWYGDRFWGGTATLDRVDLAAVSRWLGAGVAARGSLGGRFEVTADGSGFAGAAGRLELTAGDLRLGNAYTEPLISWEGGELGLSGGTDAVRATLALDLPGSDWLEGRLGLGWNAADPSVTGRLRAELHQLHWLSELVPDLADPEGQASVRADLSGTLGTPALTGRFEWRDGTAFVPALGLQPAAMQVVAELADGMLEFAAQGASGEGTFRSTGQFDIGGGDVAGEAVLQGENLLVVALPDARVIADPDLRLAFSRRSLAIEGEVRVPFARLTGVARPAAVGVSRDEVVIGPLVDEEARPELAVTSRVRVVAGADVRVRLAGLRGAIEGSVLTAIQSDVPPWGRGELRIADGSFNALGQRLDIERGRLMYTGGPLDDPRLEIRTVRRVGAITAGAQVRGTLQQPELSLFSDPPMARAEILSYLSFGTSLTNLRSSDRGAVNQAAGVLAVSEGGALARDLTRRIGLGNADVAVEGGVDGAALVMGRYLGGGLYVGYGLGLFDTVNTLRLRLLINSRLALEGTSGDVVTADLVHTIERD